MMSRPSTSSGLSEEASARAEHHRRAQVGEQVELLAQRQQAALGLLGERQGVPLRAADGAEHDGVDGLGLREGRVGERRAVHVVGGAADQVLLDREADLAGACRASR